MVGKAAPMRDLVLREALTTMAGDAALRMRELLAAGQEVPYEVREAGSGSPLAEYVPQTARFIRDHAPELGQVDSFGSACAALEAAGLAGIYLEEMGVAEPADARRRAELAGIVFLCRLWQGSTDFTLDDARLEATVDELLDLGDVGLEEVEIAVPLRGLQMGTERLELAGATIVSAESVEVPAEARAPEGMGAAAWDPIFLAVARVELPDDPEAEGELGVRAVSAFRRLVTTLRLFKAGGVALGPHAWIRPGGHRWRRIATGAGKPRPGGYRLADTELGDLAAFSRALAEPSTPFARIEGARGGFPAALGRAISRFEAGLERPLVLEALNDYLLTLRFMLEGGGPAGLGMPMRVAALCAEPDGRTEVKATVELALALERELWSGEPAPRSHDVPPAEIAAEVEELVRAILKDAACGHLGHELRTTADEILLGDGLAAGEGSIEQRGETAEWNPDEESEVEYAEAYAPYAEEQEVADVPFEPDVPFAEPPSDELELGAEPELDLEPEGDTTSEAISPPEPAEPRARRAPEERIRIVRAENKLHEVLDRDAHLDFEWPAERPEPPAPRAERRREPAPEQRDPRLEQRAGQSDELPDNVRPLHAVPAESPVAALIADSGEHQRGVTQRVSFLFPRPDTCEWKVPEVGYDRKRRADVDDPLPRG